MSPVAKDQRPRTPERSKIADDAGEDDEVEHSPPTHAFAAFLGGGGQSHGHGSIHRRSDGVGRSAPYHPTGSSHVSTEASSMLALPAVHATGRDVTPMDGTKLATSLAVPPSGEVPATGRPSC